MRFEPHSPEFKVPSLKAGKTMFFALIEPKIAACARQTCKAEPLLLRNGIQRRVKTKHMKSLK
jgi:hypothetical protein